MNNVEMSWSMSYYCIPFLLCHTSRSPIPFEPVTVIIQSSGLLPAASYESNFSVGVIEFE